MMGIMVPETCQQAIRSAIKIHLLHLVGILFPHIIDDARSKSHQICIHDFSLTEIPHFRQSTQTEEDFYRIEFCKLYFDDKKYSH
jgi:hypothetical protein